jgi:hypothetical protein
MTKKSQSRLDRDRAQKKMSDSNIWDDVMNISHQCYQLLRSHLHLQGLVQNDELRGAVKDISLLEKNIIVLSKDLSSLREELDVLTATHSTRSGKASSPDEHMQGISIYEKYHMFIERHQNVVMPNAMHILDQFNEAEQILSNVKKQAEILDPTVISDAVIVSEETKPDSSST